MKPIFELLILLSFAGLSALSQAQSKVSPFDGYWLSTTRVVSGDMIFGVLVRNHELSLYETSVPTDLGDPDMPYAKLTGLKGTRASLALTQLEQEGLSARETRLVSSRIELVGSKSKPRLLVRLEFEDLKTKERSLDERVYRKSSQTEVKKLVEGIAKFRDDFFNALWTLDTTVISKNGKIQYFLADADRTDPYLRIKNLFFHDQMNVEINQTSNSMVENQSVETLFEFTEDDGLRIYLPGAPENTVLNFGDIKVQGDRMTTRYTEDDGTVVERLFLKRGQSI